MRAAPATGSGPPAACIAAVVPPGSSVTTKQSPPSRPASTTGDEVEVAHGRHHPHRAQEDVGVERPDHGDDHRPPLGVPTGVGGLGPSRGQTPLGAVALYVDGLGHAASRGRSTVRGVLPSSEARKPRANDGAPEGEPNARTG